MVANAIAGFELGGRQKESSRHQSNAASLVKLAIMSGWLRSTKAAKGVLTCRW